MGSFPRVLFRLCENIGRQHCYVAICLFVRYFGERAAICARFPIFGLKSHRSIAFAAHHLTVLGVVTIVAAIAYPAAFKCDVNSLVLDPLDNELHPLSRIARLEQVQLLRNQLARVQMQILTRDQGDHWNVAPLRKIRHVLPYESEGNQEQETSS